MEYPIYYPTFFTATILEWKHLLKPYKFKDIIINSLYFLVNEKRVEVFGFVIMSNHLHLIWRISNNHKQEEVQLSFMKYTAQIMLKELRNNHPKVLEHFLVEAFDRKHQIWERNPLNIELHSNEVFYQKLNYIHANPVKAGLVLLAEDYKNSSASLYLKQNTNWNFLTQWNT